MALLGDAKTVAQDFAENLSVEFNPYAKQEFEYISELSIFGLPMIHINTSPYGTAKGIIAIGSKAIGIVSLGGFAVGVIAIGGVGAGLFTFGGIAIGLLFAIGGQTQAQLMLYNQNYMVPKGHDDGSFYAFKLSKPFLDYYQNLFKEHVFIKQVIVHLFAR